MGNRLQETQPNRTKFSANTLLVVCTGLHFLMRMLKPRESEASLGVKKIRSSWLKKRDGYLVRLASSN